MASYYRIVDGVLQSYSGNSKLDNTWSEFFVSDQGVYSPQEVQDYLDNEKAQITSTEYQRLRVREYPSIGDQLDALFHAGVFPEEMAQQIQAVKDKYPKEAN